ncbi:MAG TPA: SIS domain-containing protein [Phycisphaerae bacterium]|nr:SIS domain-containing protein [Phycisphaerae bacterium]HRY71141.1 SIS domain-containing protein [Phycisphaerae bacterium]HSA29773.1 SIS domain-containing protein [Phycisphaerae bacterium]
MDKIIREFIQEHLEGIQRLDAARQAEIAAAARLLIDCFRSGGRVYIGGNGGSAADAQHIAAELVGRFLRERPGLPCVALTTDTSALTAISNDYGFDRVFARQVEALVRPGDVFWVLSTSGKSPNVVEAARAARARGAKVLGFLGGTGGDTLALCDVCFLAPAKPSYAVQHLHQLAYHILCDLVERDLTLAGT